MSQPPQFDFDGAFPSDQAPPAQPVQPETSYNPYPQQPPAFNVEAQNAPAMNYQGATQNQGFQGQQQQQGNFADFQNFGSTGTGMLANAAFQNFGQQFVGQSNQVYNQSFGTLKYYFNVNTSYVKNKLKLLLFPFRQKHWKRHAYMQTSPGGADVSMYPPPREDINAPDLYIPLMAVVTYVLLIGFAMGTSLKFTPDVLGMTASNALAVLFFEVGIIKLGMYLLNASSVPTLDILAFCGYKFVHIVISVLVGFFFGGMIFHMVMLPLAVFCAYFMTKNVKLAIMDSVGAALMEQSRPRKYFVLAIGVLQVLIIYYMSYDRHLFIQVYDAVQDRVSESTIPNIE